jgi:hypothetical protein
MNRKIILSVLIIIVSSCGQVDEKKQTEVISEKEDKAQIQINPNKAKEKKIERWFEPSTLDTIFDLENNISLTLKQADSINITEYFLDNKIIDSLIKPFDNRHLEALEIEKYILKTNSDVARKDSLGLSLKLKDGSWKLLALDPMTDEADNTFEYNFTDFDFYSVRVQWGEGNGYKLISALNGEETNLFGRPYFSKNGQYVISVNVDIEAGYSENGFQLFKNNKGKLVKVFSYTPNGWGPFSIKWTDQNTLIMKNETVEFENGEMKYIEFYSELKITNGG